MISLKFNKSDYKLIVIFTIIMTIWLALKFYTENYSLGQILFDIPIIILKTLAALFMLRWIAQKFFVERQQYFLFLILGIAALVITGFVDLLRDYLGSGRTWSDLPSVGYIIVHSFYYSSADLAMPFLVIMIKKYFENQTSLAVVKEKQKDAELKLLRSQLSPHFLFNNLNTVDALIDSDTQKAKTYIARLSSLYRYFIKTKEDDIVLLQEELKMAKDYFYLIQTRYGDAYTFEVVDESAIKMSSDAEVYTEYSRSVQAYIPSGALQTVIENVVKHNKITHGISIHIYLRITEEAIILTNSKNSDAKSAVESMGTGLKNLKERYELLVGKTISITDTNTHFEVCLPLVTLTNID
ncbi:sensor histidine kinase [uncultured Dokdonia sp.]|uniref:sensor histidine kinase n=1 Tax=uncultured Dokdonia sp. TaxID=575653 RepID=UPI002607C49F|nr:sensor histidine kinase [uncultured Dokdonia sp.]